MSNNSDFKYNKKVSFRSVAPPSSKHGQDPKTKKEIESWLKYNLEEKNAKRYSGKWFEANNSPKQDNLINNLLFFIDFVVFYYTFECIK
jgi:hypothetical protein